MSRLAKKGIPFSSKVEVTLGTDVITVKGPLGTLSLNVRPGISFEIKDNTIFINPKDDALFTRALVGTYASRLKAMIQGVETPFKKVLILEGVGYRTEVKGKDLALNLGFSHPVIKPIPEGITVTSEKGTVTITGIDKVAVGQFASSIRNLKKPEPYKGKGFRYDGEVIRRKQGKKSV